MHQNTICNVSLNHVMGCLVKLKVQRVQINS